MTSRREFIQRGVAISAVPLLVDPLLPVDAAQIGGGRPCMAVFDRRFVQCCAFARAAARIGIPVHSIAGDVTALWYDDLYHRWQHESAALTGLTTVSSLFCLQQLAWKCERRVVFRAVHAYQADGVVEQMEQRQEPLASWVIARRASG